MLLGVDTGGTFTDFVFFDGAALRIHKVLSTPDAPDEAIARGVGDMGLDLSTLRVVHGSTVATNAVLESKGVRTVFVTNRGLRDMLTIGRQTRRALYDLQPPAPPIPVPRELCLETGGRLGADGTVVEPLTSEDLDELARALRELAPQAVAVNLMFSFLDDRFERRIAERVPPGTFVSLSSEVLPEYREYERGITTWLNAWVGPLVQGYLQRLTARLAPAPVSVMQSSGATIAVGQAAGRAVHMLLSGPAGGLCGAQLVGRLVGRDQLLTFDMGGTSTDVALIDAELRLTSEGHVGPYPVGVPMVDMHTIGAGGGSIARIDAGGLLQVGPESAGAAPGPVCYGKGGREPTVTDANLVLGRLRPEAFLGGRLTLDAPAAHRALAGLAGRMGVPPERAALGVVRVANEHMAAALRVISVERGVDPRGMTLVSFGGAGGLHVCALAEQLEMAEALVPVHAGVLSALGMLAAPPGRQLSRTVLGSLSAQTTRRVEREFSRLETMGRDALHREGVALKGLVSARSLDLRYRGQSFTLNVPWRGLEAAAPDFHAHHRRRYGHSLDLPVEVVNVRVSLTGTAPALKIGTGAPGPGRVKRIRLYGDEGEAQLWDRCALAPERVVQGPALITENVATTYVAPGWRCTVDAVGNLRLNRESTA